MTVVDSFPESHRGRPSIYPWDELTNGQTHKLERGIDFETSCESFRALAHRTAKTRDLKAKTKIKGNYVFLQFLKPKPKS